MTQNWLRRLALPFPRRQDRRRTGGLLEEIFDEVIDRAILHAERACRRAAPISGAAAEYAAIVEVLGMRQHQAAVRAWVAVDVYRLAAATHQLDLLLQEPPEFHDPDIGGAQHLPRAVHDRTLRCHHHDVLGNDIVADPISVPIMGRYLEPR